LGFFFGDMLQAATGVSKLPLSMIMAVLFVLLGFWMTSERLRPVDENPISRLILWIYEPLLRLFLARKGTFLIIPSVVIVLGLGAWVGLPTVLKPVEQGATLLGANLNEVPGYVDLKHTFTGLESDDWIALD